MYGEAFVVAVSPRPEKKKTVLNACLLAGLALLLSGLAVWQFLADGMWAAGAAAGALVFFFALAVYLPARAAKPKAVLKLSKKNVFIRREKDWACVPLKNIALLHLVRLGKGRDVIEITAGKKYRSLETDDADAAFDAIALAMDAARQN